MKTKKVSKKLALNKRTIAKLNSDGMDAIFGGIGETYGAATCDDCMGASRFNPTVCLSVKTRCQSDCQCITDNCPSDIPTVCC
jgi:hypothetical protein